MADDKKMKEQLEKICQVVNKEYGEKGRDAITFMGNNNRKSISRFPSGCLSLDLCLGVSSDGSMGFPKGRHVEVYGQESSGKTTICLHAIAGHQFLFPEEITAFIDTEHALDPDYAETIGVDVEKMLISQPDSGEDALNIVETLVNNGVGLIVVDSVAALTPQAEIDGDMGDAHVGLQARMMSQALRKLSSSVSKNNATIIWTNQVREKIGVLYGNPEVTSGGRALRFYSSIRMEVRGRKDKDSDGNFRSGVAKIKMVKNKTAPPFKSCEVPIDYGSGINAEKDLILQAVEYDIINKRGSWFSYNEEQVGQGMDNTVTYLSEDPEMFESIKVELLRCIDEREGHEREMRKAKRAKKSSVKKESKKKGSVKNYDSEETGKEEEVVVQDA